MHSTISFIGVTVAMSKQVSQRQFIANIATCFLAFPVALWREIKPRADALSPSARLVIVLDMFPREIVRSVKCLKQLG